MAFTLSTDLNDHRHWMRYLSAIFWVGQASAWFFIALLLLVILRANFPFTWVAGTSLMIVLGIIAFFSWVLKHSQASWWERHHFIMMGNYLVGLLFIMGALWLKSRNAIELIILFAFLSAPILLVVGLSKAFIVRSRESLHRGYALMVIFAPDWVVIRSDGGREDHFYYTQIEQFGYDPFEKEAGDGMRVHSRHFGLKTADATFRYRFGIFHWDSLGAQYKTLMEKFETYMNPPTSDDKIALKDPKDTPSNSLKNDLDEPFTVEWFSGGRAPENKKK